METAAELEERPDAAIDLQFALPTAVAGIALTALYARNGWVGGLLEPLGIKVAYTPLGIAVFLAGLWVFNRLSPSFEDFL